MSQITSIIRVFTDYGDSEGTFGYFTPDQKQQAIDCAAKILPSIGVEIEEWALGPQDFNYRPVVLLCAYEHKRYVHGKPETSTYTLNGEWADDFPIPEAWKNITRLR